MPGITESAEKVASNVVGGLVGTPTLLVMVVLNVIMIVAAAWFLAKMEDNRHEERVKAGDLFAQCMSRVPQPPPKPEGASQ